MKPSIYSFRLNVSKYSKVLSFLIKIKLFVHISIYAPKRNKPDPVIFKFSCKIKLFSPIWRLIFIISEEVCLNKSILSFLIKNQTFRSYIYPFMYSNEIFQKITKSLFSYLKLHEQLHKLFPFTRMLMTWTNINLHHNIFREII